MMQLQQNALSRPSLTAIIMGQNLYVKERKALPLEEIIQDMRDKDVRFRWTNVAGVPGIAVEFSNQNPATAQATARALVSSLMQKNAGIEVLSAASLPSRPVSPDRRRVMINGLLAGLLTGLVGGGIWSIVRKKGRWSVKRIGVFAAVGVALGLTVAYLIPDEFVSTAVLRSTKIGEFKAALPAALSDDSLAAIVHQIDLFPRELSKGSMSEVTRRMRNEFIRVQQIQAGPGGEAMVISFRYPDRFKAQAVTRDLLNRFFTPHTVEVLDPANLPAAPSSPNRVGIVGFAAVAGILLGLAASRLHRPKVAAAKA
jgi:capsular polysaccharide biosynthesis protein